MKSAVVTLILFALSLLPLPQARFNAVSLAAQQDAPNFTVQAKTIERKSPSGEISARLQIRPENSAGSFRFETEDFESRSPAKLIGVARISQTEVLVQAEEPRSGTKLNLRAKADTPTQTTVTLSLNRLSFDFVVDERVQSLVNDARKLAARGATEAEIAPTAREITSALQINTGYKAFVQQVKRSAAFDALVAIDSLVATASSEELRSNVALLILRSTARLFAPPPIRNQATAQKTGGNAKVAKVSHMKNAVYPLMNPASNSNLFQNPLCAAIFAECLIINNCGGYGQPIDALCFLGCTALAIGCDLIT